ncbi:MAG: cupin domain-containing protein [Candidatus Deferrimicrobiaceae bacterium]
MHHFWKPEDIPPRELAPGVIAKIASGEKAMLSLVTLAPHAVVPEHAHPHEQMGMMVSGTLELTIAGEARTLSGNAIFLVPGGVSHKAVAGPQGAMVLEAFSPPREEFREAGVRPSNRFPPSASSPPCRSPVTERRRPVSSPLFSSSSGPLLLSLPRRPIG